LPFLVTFRNAEIVEDISDMLLISGIDQSAILVNGHDANNRLPNVLPPRDKRSNLLNVCVRVMPVGETPDVLRLAPWTICHDVAN
jgi:hypothetical protein